MQEVEVKKLLNEKGLRITDFRSEVLGCFVSSNKALNVKEVEKYLGQFDRVTLYRTIKSFLSKGLIHEAGHWNGEIHYAICKEGCSSGLHNHQHVHFECEVCEAIYCVSFSEFPKINLPGWTINEIDISTKGVCPDCGNNF